MSLIGLPIGFYGYILPGNINLMIIHLYSSKKYRFLLLSLGLILLFETLYCIVSLLLLNTLKSDVTVFRAIEIISYLLVTAMGLWMIAENKKNKERVQKNTVYRGLISIIFHPQQIPFWVIMGVLIHQFVPFDASRSALYQFAFYNAVGTLLAMLFYMVFGSRLINYLKLNLSQLNKIMGAVYILLAIYGFFFSS